MVNLNYRDTLNADLNGKRNKKRIPIIQKSSRQLAENLLEKESNTDEYKKARLQKFVNLLKNSEWRLTRKLNKEIAMELISSWEFDIVFDNQEKFEWINHRDIAIQLMKNWTLHFSFDDYMNKLTGLSLSQKEELKQLVELDLEMVKKFEKRKAAQKQMYKLQQENDQLDARLKGLIDEQKRDRRKKWVEKRNQVEYVRPGIKEKDDGKTYVLN